MSLIQRHFRTVFGRDDDKMSHKGVKQGSDLRGKLTVSCGTMDRLDRKLSCVKFFITESFVFNPVHIFYSVQVG